MAGMAKPMTTQQGLDMLELAIMRRFGRSGWRRDMLEEKVGALLNADNA